MNALPSVSVIMSARDASETVGRTLQAILEQDYERGLQVVVSVPRHDPTRVVLEPFVGRIAVVDNPDHITPTGLNAALEAAHGSVIVRCDAHAVLPPDYVRTAVKVLEESGADVVGGVQRPVGTGLFQRAVAVAQSTPLGVGDARYRLGGKGGPVDTVYLGVFRREALMRVGGYAEDLERNQDYEMNHRIRASGGLVWFDPRLVVDYLPRDRPAALWRQYFAYGRWKRVVVRRHPASLRWRQLAAPLLVTGLAGSGLAAGLGLGAASMALPLLYGGAVVATGIVETVRRRDPSGLLAPVALTIMHVAWGLGFMLGRARSRSTQE